MAVGMEKKLSEFLRNINIKIRQGGGDPLISGLAYDSRKVEPGFLFFALPGIHDDGERYVGEAVRHGARAIVHQKPLASYEDGIAYLRVDDARFSMSSISAAFYGHPSRDLAVIGVTGTEGKSTTVYLIYQLLCLLGRKAGFISTVQYRSGAEEVWNPEHQTTPEATAIHRALAEMRDYGMEYAVIESSSHGLSPRTNRLGDVEFDAAVMLNVTHEHLEFHGSVEQYRQDKCNLFRALDAHGHEKTMAGQRRSIPSFGVVNADDPFSPLFAQATAKEVLSFSAKPSSARKADLRAKDIQADSLGNSFTLIEGKAERAARIELPGAFNVDNCLAAMLCVSRITGTDALGLIGLLPSLKSVRGRMTRVDSGQDFELLIDYAHTPSSFEAIFPSIRKRAGGRVISLFGSGGERDTEKRPLQGRIASAYSDIVILADEDPRGEDPRELLEMIAAGCEGKKRGESLLVIPDRPTAIRAAFALARPGDIVLLLGKGHENSIIGKEGPVPYDEISEARRALSEMGFGEQTDKHD
jgi:UDP-N-acetylmuramoyl-L-alanyl-D-glutamate--2,6-diaminopimelate ligase